MWSTHAAPGFRGQTKMAKSNSENATAFVFSNPDPSSRAYPAALQHQHSVSALEAEHYTDFLEPAVEGPPSPSGIRAFSSRVRQASVSDRHVSQQTSSSAASSLLSHASMERRPSLEQALESFSLSRKSSTKSTSSSMPSRERPESVQAIGKAIFNRKSKFRRESLATSGSSTYSSDMMVEPPSDRGRAASVTREHIQSAMSLFNRRKTVQAGEDVPAPKKPLISSPFNFQHVSQIQRDQLASMDRANSTTLRSELSNARSPPLPTKGASRGSSAEGLRVPNFSSKTSRAHHDDDSIPPHVVPRSREGSVSRSPTSQLSPPMPGGKQARPQDRMRGHPPPRPPRSPTQLDMGYFDYVPPMPPARHPCRTASLPRRDSEALGNTMSVTSLGMKGFSFSTPFEGGAYTPPLGSPGCPSPGLQENRRFSRMFGAAAENPNWPLTAPLENVTTPTFDAGLPDVPEEEEQSGLPKRSRPSTRSTHSSLKGSMSVPALRQMSTSGSGYSPHDRTYSRDSVVLGHQGMSAAQRSVTDMMLASNADGEPLRRDSWEAVIDYCYDHEMEADDDYDWHRPSVDIGQEEPTLTVTESEDDGPMLSRPTSEVPALSPTGHLSPQTSNEAITPTLAVGVTKSPMSANFSLPRRDAPRAPSHLHVRVGSQASFKEAQGFTLSPTFLIPTDYHQELLAARNEQYEDPENIVHAVTLEDSTLTMESSNLFVPARASNSTTASNSNLSSRSVFERHISATSSNTDYTRLTMSTTSDMEAFVFKDDSPIVATAMEEQIPEAHETFASPSHTRSHSAAGLLHPSKAPSESNPGGLQSPKRQAGRARSRTMSSTPGQFSLFPAVSNTRAPPTRG